MDRDLATLQKRSVLDSFPRQSNLSILSYFVDSINHILLRTICSTVGSERPFRLFFFPSSWTTGLCEELIKQNKKERRTSISLKVLIKSAMVTDRIRTCAISNSSLKPGEGGMVECGVVKSFYRPVIIAEAGNKCKYNSAVWHVQPTDIHPQGRNYREKEGAWE
ncbi:hypothetical protein J6590_026370 [Homalodisca vitripennis]|nr:hypothetical protein J6590_026370 [Homalodisca vitripennis]